MHQLSTVKKNPINCLVGGIYYGLSYPKVSYLAHSQVVVDFFQLLCNICYSYLDVLNTLGQLKCSRHYMPCVDN